MTVVTQLEYGQLPAVRISAADGASATVALFGGHLLSWRGADGKERLFMSRQSALDGSKAIRGGVPLIFPQFNERGDGARHGFARTSVWRLAGSGSEGQGEDEGKGAWASFSLSQHELAPAVAQAWPHAFTLELRVAVHGNTLELALSVRNDGSDSFPFGLALHSYFAVDQLEQASVAGLQHVHYTDHLQNSAVQHEALLRLEHKLDRIYAAPPALTLATGAGSLTLEQQGYSDWVVWNPGPADAAALSDLADEEYQRFVCIEAARVNQQELEAGARWTGRHRITVAAA